MIYNTELKFAIKDADGRYLCKDTSVFEIKGIGNYLSAVQVQLGKQKEIFIVVECPICGAKHEYQYNLSDLIKRQMTIGGCEVTGSPIWFLGKPMKVSKFINKFDEINRKAYAMI